MSHGWWRWFGWVTPLLWLAACGSYAPPETLKGLSQDELRVKMGPPETQRQTGAGLRLEFPRGPFGKHTWFVYFDAAGRADRFEQVLTEQNFDRIEVGMDREAVRQLLGRPSEVQGLGRSRGEVWSYRYENQFCQWFQVELSLERQVRSTGYGQPPECMTGDDVIVP